MNIEAGLRKQCQTSIGSVVICLLVSMLAVPSAYATHFRYGHLTWVPRSDIDQNAVDFTVQNVWRRSAYSTSNGRCIDATTLGSVACSGADGFASVGDLIWEDQGDTKLDPGDGSGLIGGPGSLSNALVYEVTAADAATDWIFGLAVDPAELAVGVIDTAITHTYAAAGDYPAELADCCRIRPCAAPTGHMNNPRDRYDVNTVVNASAGNSSPVSNLPSVILCPIDGLCEFTVPASDNELDPLSFRLSTTAEARFTSQPGPPQCPAAASIDATTGIYSWDTTGCNLASDPNPEPPVGGCNNPTYNTCYSTQVTVEETPPGTGSSGSAVDFFVCLVGCPPANTSPVFEAPTPTCGSVISAGPGVMTSFGVQASDVETDVSLNVTGLPSGATMTPALPTAGNPVSSSFDWTPAAGDLGQHIITFEASDGCAPVLCSITIDVSAEDCTDGIDNDGDGLADCADPDCHGVACADIDGNVCTDAACDAVAGICDQSFFLNTSACDDGNACTTGDVCGGGVCAGTDTSAPCDDLQFCTVDDRCAAGTCAGDPRDCDDGNDCTADSCDETNDTCVDDSIPLEGQGCDDGRECTDPDICAGGACTSVKLPSGASCDEDGSLCTIDQCDGLGNCLLVDGVFCQPPCAVCDDGTGNCVPDPGTQDGTPCDDGLFCTAQDECNGELCVGVPNEACLGAFKCYRSKQRTRFKELPQLDLTDAFTASAAVPVKKPRRICNPADLDDLEVTSDEDLLNDGKGAFQNPLAHLMCYKIREPVGFNKLPGNPRRFDVVVEDRFGRDRYSIKEARTFCTPAVMTAVQDRNGAIDAPPLEENVCHGGTDNGAACVNGSDCSSGECSVPTLADVTGVHDFKCYSMRRARATPPFERREKLEIADRFEGHELIPSYTKRTIAKKPKLFCPPAAVGTDPVPSGPSLLCYKIKDSRTRSTCEGGGSNAGVPCLNDGDCPGGVCGAPVRQNKFLPLQFESSDSLQILDPPLKAVRASGLRVSFICVPSFATVPSPSGAFLDRTRGILD